MRQEWSLFKRSAVAVYYTLSIWWFNLRKRTSLTLKSLKFRLVPPKPYNLDLAPESSTPGGKQLVLFFSPHVFGDSPVLDHLKSATMPPGIEISMNRDRLKQASAVIFHVPDFDTLDGIPKFPGQVWVAWSGECQQHRPHQDFLDRFDLHMTYKTGAEVFAPYIPNLEDLERPVSGGKRKKLVCFFASNIIEFSGRTSYAARLMRSLQVDSYGKCLNNCQIGEDKGQESKLDIMRQYKFDLAFENAIDQDYVTEKFYEPLIAGTVPVYLGAPNVDDFAPGDNCFIDCREFKSPKDLARYLRHLDNTPEEYQRFLDWKNRPFREPFLKMASRSLVDQFTRLFNLLEERSARERKRGPL